MTKRTKVFLSVAVGILVIGLGTGLVASYVGLQNLPLIGREPGPAELSYIPADTHALAFASVRNVMDSQVRRRLTGGRVGASAEADHFKEETGIDLEKDVDYIVASVSGNGEPGAATLMDRPLVLVRGRFDRSRIESLAKSQGGDVEDYNGVQLFVNDQMKLAGAFLAPGLVAIGTPEAVRRAIDTKSSGVSVRTNDELMRLVGQIEDGHAWAVARFDALANGRLPAQIVNQLPPISWFSVRGFIDTGVRGQLRVEARDEEAAKNLADVIRGFVALARMQAGQHAELTTALDALQLTGEGKTVSLSFSIPSEVIDALGALRAQRPPPGPEVTPPPPPRGTAQPAL